MRFPRFLVCAAAVILAGQVRAESADLAKIADQYREYYLGTGRSDRLTASGEAAPGASETQALKFAEKLGAGGSWADIDYANQDRSAWPAANHVSRLVAMAAALAAPPPGAPAGSAATLRQACDRAMAFWRERNPLCPNWWFNEIGIPQMLGRYALFRGPDLPRADFDFITAVTLARSTIGMTGQNYVWRAGNTLVRAVLQGDERLARTAATAIWSQVEFGGEEGLQPDWSFHQHGPQQQFGNYGLAFAVEISRWATILRGTSLALPPERAGYLRNFLLEGENWVCWRGEMDLSSCGRQITPHSQRSKTKDLFAAMADQELADPAHTADYAAFIARNRPGAPNDLVGYRYFWRSDYAVYRRPEMFATVKMCSARVIGGELVNRENLAGRYLADGATLLYRRGDEYADIAPVWDWHHIPGTTTIWEPKPPRNGKARENRLPSSWVGGASDGQSGCAVLDYDRDGVRAHKAWFFHADRIVCLAAGISGQGDLPVNTTINQCLLRGKVRVGAGEGHIGTAPAGVHEFRDVDWVEHDGWRYTFFQPRAVVVADGPRTGHWSVEFQTASTPRADVSKSVFGLWIDHGRRPQGAAAAWEAAPVDAAGPEPELLANSPDLQAVRWGPACAQAAFWKRGSGEILPGLPLAVDQPCLVLVERSGPSWRISVADPSERLPRIGISFAGRTRDVDLPSGPEAGSTASVGW